MHPQADPSKLNPSKSPSIMINQHLTDLFTKVFVYTKNNNDQVQCEIFMNYVCNLLDMANIVLLLVIIMLVFSVIGITLFRDSIPEHFSNLSTGILYKL